MKTFDHPIYVSRPLAPDMSLLTDMLKGVWDARWFTNNGALCKRLETALAGHLHVPGLSLYNNGTTALIAVLKALRLTGEVIVTPFTFAATVHALDWCGLTPVFCDIKEDDMTIDPARIESLITSKTSAILGVHVFGNPCDFGAIQAIAGRHGLKVIYDAAHAFGTEVYRAAGLGLEEFVLGVGTFGDASVFSFHATKLFHTAEGGAVTTVDPLLKSRLDMLRNFGIQEAELGGEGQVMMPGINGKMDEVRAALGLLVFDLVEKERAERLFVKEAYKRSLSGVKEVSIVEPSASVSRESLQYLVIRVAFGRDRVWKALREHNVFARRYFYPLCSDFSCYKGNQRSKNYDAVGSLFSGTAALRELPVATGVSREVLSLPFYGDLSDEDVAGICEIIKGSV